MAIGFYRHSGVNLPHPSIPLHLFLIVEQAISQAWTRLKRNPPVGFNIATALEEEVTLHLYDVLVNDVYRRRLVPGFSRETFNPPQREPKVCSFDRSSIKKMPDLRIDLVGRPKVSLLTDDGIFIECKPVDATHSISNHYCKKGVSRFVVGEYGWAMPEGLMIAYVVNTHKGTPSEPLISLKDALIDSQKSAVDELATTLLPTKCPFSKASRSSTITHSTRHSRSFTYIQNGKPAPELLLRHLWLRR